MGVRVGVGLSALVLVLGATASASADELSPELSALDVAGEAIKAKGDKAKESAEDDHVADERAKAKNGPAEGTQVAQNTQGRGGAADQAEEEEEAERPDGRLPPRVPWRGTAIAWDNSFTTSAAGVGDDPQSRAHEQYIQTFSLGLNYFFVEQDQWNLAVATTPSLAVEITDSNTTTTRREPWFNDLPVTVAFRARPHTNPAAPTGVVLLNTVLLTTSPGSYNTGTYLTTSPRAVFWQSIPLLGEKSPALQAVTAGVSLRWDHRFGRATTPEQEGLNQPRQSLAPGRDPTHAADALGFNRFAQNMTQQVFWLFFGEDIGPTQLMAFGGFILNQRFLYDNQDCVPNANVSTLEPGQCINISGEGQPGGGDVPVQHSYGFTVGATLFPVPELGISLGYTNLAGQLGEDGRRRNIMYSPYAQFSAGLALSLDAIYEVITGPRRNTPFFLVAQNDDDKKKKKNNNDQQRQSPTQAGISF
jgi:hypothetical protein